jgi:hypothetical protein
MIHLIHHNPPLHPGSLESPPRKGHMECRIVIHVDLMDSMDSMDLMDQW